MVRPAAFLLLFLGLLGPGLPALAQGTPPDSKADTLRAVRAYFAERRNEAQSQALLGGITVGVGGAAGVAGASAGNLGAGVYVLGGLVLAAVGVPLLVVGKSQQKELTPGREAAVVSAYEQGHALPREISRRLARRHFAQ